MVRTLRDSREDWKISYFHHPLYSDAGRHGSSIDLRLRLEPLLIKYGTDVVFSGHDHLYERVKPQHASPTSSPARAASCAREIRSRR